MQCANCNATNPDSARFCGQCYARFDAPAPRSAAPMAPAAPLTPSAPTGQVAPAEEPGSLLDHLDTPLFEPLPELPAEAEGLAPRRHVATSAGRFHSDGEVIGWTCAVCGEANDLSVFSCRVCGTRMDAEDRKVVNVDTSSAKTIEALVPGLGHIRIGHTGMGVARMALAALWAIGILLLVLSGSAGVIAAIPLVAGIGIIWISGPTDVERLARGKSPMLTARRFMWLVLGTTGGVISFGAISVIVR